MKMDNFQHMTATKGFLIGAIRSHGTSIIAPDWKGTADEMISAIEADPREVIPLGDCDNQDASGRCLGHKR